MLGEIVNPQEVAMTDRPSTAKDRALCKKKTKKGKRCRNKAMEKGLCAVHLRAFAKKRSFLQKLLTAGKYATAVAALLKLIEEVGPVYHVIHTTIAKVIESVGQTQRVPQDGEKRQERLYGGERELVSEYVYKLHGERTSRGEYVKELFHLRMYLHGMTIVPEYNTLAEKQNRVLELLADAYIDDDGVDPGLDIDLVSRARRINR